MKESMWGVFIVSLGVLGITLMAIFTDIASTNEENYYLIKEATNAAMYESIDLAYYRENGEIKISADKFAENFARRFAESASKLKTYNVEIFDVQELPPKVSLKVESNVAVLPSIGVDTFEVSNNISEIIEMVKEVTEADIAIVESDSITAKDLTIYQGEKGQVLYDIYPGNYTNKEVSFSFINGSNNCAVIDPSTGIVTGIENENVSPCTRTIKVTTLNGKSATAKVTVKPYITISGISGVTNFTVCQNEEIVLADRIVINASDGTKYSGREYIDKVKNEGGEAVQFQIENDSGTSKSVLTGDYGAVKVQGIGVINYSVKVNEIEKKAKISADSCKTTTTKKTSGGVSCDNVKIKGSFVIETKNGKNYVKNDAKIGVTIQYSQLSMGTIKVEMISRSISSKNLLPKPGEIVLPPLENRTDDSYSAFINLDLAHAGDSLGTRDDITVRLKITGGGFNCTKEVTILAEPLKAVLTIKPTTVGPGDTITVSCKYSDGSIPASAEIFSGKKNALGSPIFYTKTGVASLNINPGGSIINITDITAVTNVMEKYTITCYLPGVEEKDSDEKNITDSQILTIKPYNCFSYVAGNNNKTIYVWSIKSPEEYVSILGDVATKITTYPKLNTKEKCLAGGLNNKKYCYYCPSTGYVYAYDMPGCEKTDLSQYDCVNECSCDKKYLNGKTGTFYCSSQGWLSNSYAISAACNYLTSKPCRCWNKKVTKTTSKKSTTTIINTTTATTTTTKKTVNCSSKNWLTCFVSGCKWKNRKCVNR